MRAALTLISIGMLAGCGGAPEATSHAEQAIYGGAVVGSCAWPSVVYVGGCTGTLVHPELVVLAAHCVPLEPASALFGDDYREPAFTAELTSCSAHPQSSELGNDIGYCRLAEPVKNLPIVPLIAGCEVSALAPGNEVVAVGFGAADDALGSGPKRAVSMPIVSLSERDAEIGGNGKDSCTGDSGGPVFVELADGSFRQFGVTSYGNACGEGGHYSLIAPALGWLEQSSGLDLTPCFEGEVWAPTEGCGGFPLSPALGGGSWAARCESADVSGASQTCGAAFDPSSVPPEASEQDAGCSVRARAPGTWAWLLVLVALRAARWRSRTA